MRGKSHVMMNCSTVVVLAETGALLRDVYKGPCCETVSSCISAVSAYFHDNGSLNKYVFAGLCVVFLFLGSLLPDIDYPHSTLGRIIYIPVEHRTWIHTIWFVILFGVGSIWFRPLVWLAFGFFFHLFWDNFSKTGICFIYPIIKKRKHHPLKLYTSSGMSEKVVVVIMLIFTFAMTVVSICTGTFVTAIKLLFGDIIPWI